MLIKSGLIAVLSMGGAGSVVYLGTEPDQAATVRHADDHPHPPKSTKKKTQSDTTKTPSGTVITSQQPIVRSEPGEAKTVEAKPTEKKRSYIDRWRSDSSKKTTTVETQDTSRDTAEVEFNDGDAPSMRRELDDKQTDLEIDIDETVSLLDDVDLPDDLVRDLEELFAKIEIDADLDGETRMEKRMIVVKRGDMERPVKTKPGSDSATARWVVKSKSDNRDTRMTIKTAMTQADKIQSRELKDQAYLDIVQYANSERQFDDAQTALKQINQTELRDTARARIAVALAKSGETDEAFAIIDSVEIDELRDVMRLQVIEAMILPDRMPAVGSRPTPRQ